MLPGVPVFVRDSFGDGQGAMRGAAWGLIPVVAAEGRIPAVTTSDLWDRFAAHRDGEANCEHTTGSTSDGLRACDRQRASASPSS